MDTNHPYSELRDKLMAGTNLAFKRLVEKAKLHDDDLIFSENGKVVKVKARSLDIQDSQPNMNTSNPLFTLSISEFSDLIRKIVSEELQKSLAPKTAEYEDEHFTIEGLKKFLNCSKASVHNYKKSGMPYYRIGRKVLFQKSEILAFLKTHGKKMKSPRTRY